MKTLCQVPGCKNPVVSSHHCWCRDCYNKKKGGGLASPDIAQHFRVSSAVIDAAMCDIGWTTRPQRPQSARDLKLIGKMMMRKEMDFRNGGQFIIWSPAILDSKSFSAAVEKRRGENTAQPLSGASEKLYDADAFRKKYPANYRTNDGHWVRSEGERKIDDFLHAAGIKHEYERALPVPAEDSALCDFYLPDGDVYIEYWGRSDPEYVANRNRKVAVYKKHGLNLVEIVPDEVRSLSDHLPRKLRPYGVKL